MGEGALGFTAWLLVAAYFAFVAVALSRVLRDLLHPGGMLVTSEGQPVEPERVQSVVASLATASLLGFWGGQEVIANSGSLPDIPNSLLVAFGVSQAGFVGGKFIRVRKQRQQLAQGG